jgi:hypothetical protein
MDERMMFPHPFIIQCVWPGCANHFNNHDELKKHLSQRHKVGQDELNNFEVYALMLIYHNSEKYYMKGNVKKYA